MNSYAKKELARYWPVSVELMAQYCDGSHTCSRIGIHNIYEWQKNNKLHRDDDKPAFIGKKGDVYWYQNGELHRDGDKPAYINPNDSLIWYQNGQMHRSSGPARICPDGTLEWWINNKNITHEVKAWLNRKPWCGTPEQITEFKLRFT